MKRLSMILSRKSLLTAYKCFDRPLLDSTDVIYDIESMHPVNESFKRKLEAVEYNPSLVITGAIRGTSWQRSCHEFSLESLSDSRWSCKLVFFHEIVSLVQGLIPFKVLTFHTAPINGSNKAITFIP